MIPSYFKIEILAICDEFVTLGRIGLKVCYKRIPILLVNVFLVLNMQSMHLGLYIRLCKYVCVCVCVFFLNSKLSLQCIKMFESKKFISKVTLRINLFYFFTISPFFCTPCNLHFRSQFLEFRFLPKVDWNHMIGML